MWGQTGINGVPTRLDDGFMPGVLAGQANAAQGARFVLLDSVRDAGFLGGATVQNPVAPVNDAGLGLVDNFIFVYTSSYTPGTTKKRPFPVKAFWIGSPAGTTDSTDTFSIYMADVIPGAYYAGAPASQWLTNPRLVLAASQAKSDIVTWFDANYPGGATGGVGSTNTGSNTTYGILGGGSSAVGNISGMDSIDGQFWPVYDYVDGSMVLYFSVKTPNENTKSIYAYKTSAGEGMENPSPLGSAQFLGGVVGVNAYWGLSILSSHRFTIASPDPLVLAPRVSGQQSAYVAYSGGTFDGVSPDHARWIQAFQLADVHGSTLNWSSPNYPLNTSDGGGIDSSSFYNPDKLGSLTTCPGGTAHAEGMYAMVYNATASKDARGTASPVVIDAMQIRVAYFHPGTGTFAVGSRALIPEGTVMSWGNCRPQFTTLPDGIPKIVAAAFSVDQNLQAVCFAVDRYEIQPEAQPSITVSMDSFPRPLIFPTFGKRRVHLRLFDQTGGPNPNNPQHPPVSVFQVGSYAHVGANDATPVAGLPYFQASFDDGTLLKVGFHPLMRWDGTEPPGAWPLLIDETFEATAPFMTLLGTPDLVQGTITLEG